METARWRDVVRRDLFGPRPDPRDRPYRLVIRLVLVVFRLLGLRFDVRGAEHVPASGPAVVCSNHVSYLDFTFLGLAALPRRRLVRFMAKESVFRHRVSGPLMRAMRHIPVDRRAGAAAFDAAVRALEDGHVVGVFPEATISSSFVLKDLKAGAARMAIDSGAPVLPAAVWGGQRITTKHHPVDLRRGVAVTVVLGEPIVPEPGETAPVLLGRIRTAMEALVDEAQRSYPQPPSGPEELWWQPAHLGGTAPTLQQAEARDHPDARGTRRRLPRPHPVARLRRLAGRRGRR
ncbi:lysophospholipid acyltransferase family protein [Geodermatophilus sp. SYSU D00758]